MASATTEVLPVKSSDAPWSASLGPYDALGGSQRLERIGMVAIGLCAAHWVICAWLPRAFGALSMGMRLGLEAEWMFTLVAVGASILSGRNHRSVLVAALLALGIAGPLAFGRCQKAGCR